MVEGTSNKKKVYTCPICGKTYGTKGILSIHVKREHGITLDDAIENQQSQSQFQSPVATIEQNQGDQQLFPPIRQVIQQFDLQQQLREQQQQTEVKEENIREINEENRNEIKFIGFLPEYITVRIVLRVGNALETRRALAIGLYKGIPTLLGLDSTGRFLPATFFANFVGIEGSTRARQVEAQLRYTSHFNEGYTEPKSKEKKGIRNFFSKRKKKKQPLKVIDFGDILNYE